MAESVPPRVLGIKRPFAMAYSVKINHYFAHVTGQEAPPHLSDFVRNSELGFSYATNNCTDRIAVTTDRDRISYCVLKTVGFQKTYQRLRYGILAGLIEAVIWTNQVDC